MVYGYIRVSTDMQNTENQRYEIEQFAKKNNLVIDQYVSETISGTKTVKERELGKVLKKMKKNDLLIATELSRLGRSLFMIISILSLVMEKEGKIITIKDNFRLTDDIESKVLAFAFGLSAEIERKLISQRTKEALKRRKAEGIRLGRPKGSKIMNKKLSSNLTNIMQDLRNGKSKIKIAKQYKVHYNTLRNFLRNKDLL